MIMMNELLENLLLDSFESLLQKKLPADVVASSVTLITEGIFHAGNINKQNVIISYVHDI